MPELQTLLAHVARLVDFDEAVVLLAWLCIAIGSSRLALPAARADLWCWIKRNAAQRGNTAFILLPIGLALLFVV